MKEEQKRIIIKISGEFLAGEKGYGFDIDTIDQLTDDIIEIKALGYSIGIVLGGGNFARGRELSGITRVAADNIGMLATIQNAIMVSEVLKQKTPAIDIYSSFPINKITRYFTYQSANASLDKGNICFLCGGTGNPFFTTDTTAILRAIELSCCLVLKGTNVEGIFTSDPKKDPSAEFVKQITYTEALTKKLNIMDMTAFSLARDYKIPIKVFNINIKGNLKKALLSDNIGTFVFE